MIRKEYIDKIVKYSSLFVQEVKAFNAINNYDVNIHSENVLIPILNDVFGIQLRNANELKKNYPAVDLIDEKNRIAFQVTSTFSTQKINETLEKFFDLNLDEKFDILYIYILTEKEKNFSAKKIENSIKSQFDFKIEEHIIDSNDLLRKINYIQSIEKLSALARIFEHEFSEVQIRSRERKFKDGYLQSEPEELFSNLLQIEFPGKLFVADLDFDQEKIKNQINDYRESKEWRKKKFFANRDLFKRLLINNKIYLSDWIMRENKIITLHNLNDDKEVLSKFVDKGTIESMQVQEYYSTNEDHLSNFKDLLKKSLIEMCKTKDMEWVGQPGIIRFKNNREVPNEKRLKWKGKNEATKTVIFEMLSKKKEGEDQHIICFRSMAFRPSFHYISSQWFIAINSTWSFTNPGGFKQSRYESSYMTGLKRQENNNAVYYQFRFFAYYLSYRDLFTINYPYLKISPSQPIEFIPKIDDKKWLPPKEFVAKNEREAELKIDTELNNLLF